MSVVTPAMTFRLLIAEPHAEFRKTLLQVADAARSVLPLALEVAEADSATEAWQGLARWRPDAVLLGWDIAGDATPVFIRKLQKRWPGIRVLALVPDTLPEYRKTLWAAGACAGIPRDRVDGEWLAAAVCIMRRALDREAVLRARAIQLLQAIPEAVA